MFVVRLPHVQITFSSVFPQTVSGVGGEARTLTPFNFGPGSSSTSIKRDSKMQTRGSSNCKKETTLKKGDKKQGLLRSEHSGVYTKEEVLVRHSTTAATKHSLSPASGTLHPSTQVNCCFSPLH